MNPFLKWPGAKKLLCDLLKSKLPRKFNNYFEPFIGGGSLFLYLALPNTTINDINKPLINCYQQVKTNVNNFIDQIKAIDNHKITNDYYLEIREQFNNKLNTNTLDLECAALMYWLNKRCFNGLYRISKKGQFNASWNKSTSPIAIDEDNLKQVATYLSKVKIFNEDFEQICSMANKHDFIYIDSPYVPISESASFTSYNAEGFYNNDHLRLAKVVDDLTNRKVFVMLSNHNVELVRQLYKGYYFDIIKVSRRINTDATKRSGCEEVIITNYK